MVLRIELTLGKKTQMASIFVVDSTFIYNALLGRDWIQLSSCIPSSLHRVLILWNTNSDGKREVDIVKVDVKPFVTNSSNLRLNSMMIVLDH